MDSVQYGYLRINKYLMLIIGQWPYQPLLERILIWTVFIPIVVGQFVLQGGGMISALMCDDVDAFLEGFSPCIISWMCLVKFFNYVYNHNRMKSLLDEMQQDWRTYSRLSNEYEILCQNYEVGRKVNVRYAACLYGSMTPFMFVPPLLNAADYLGIYKMSGERRHVFRLEHLLDMDRYYYALQLHAILGTLGFVTIVVAIDSMMVFYVQHECALCLILGERLKEFVADRGANVEMHPDKREDLDYQNARACVIMHKHIIEFARHLEEANSISFFFQLGFNMLGISFTVLQAVTKLGSPNTAFRHGSFVICLLSVLLLESWPGQQLSDHTDRIFEFATSGKWYQASISSRRILSVMLLRSIVPIKLTAGKLYTLNLENYSAVVRASFSYFTVLCSFQ